MRAVCLRLISLFIFYQNEGVALNRVGGSSYLCASFSLSWQWSRRRTLTCRVSAGEEVGT